MSHTCRKLARETDMELLEGLKLAVKALNTRTCFRTILPNRPELNNSYKLLAVLDAIIAKMEAK